jgi:hypothetical protein
MKIAAVLGAVLLLEDNAVAAQGYTCDTCYRINMYTVTCHWDTGGMIYGCYQTAQYDCNHHGWCVVPIVQSPQDLSPDGSLMSARFDRSGHQETQVRTESVTHGDRDVACAGYVVVRSYTAAAQRELLESMERIAI